jgi:DNA polymerase
MTDQDLPISARAGDAARKAARDGSWNGDAPTSLAEVAAGVELCRRCELWRGATQGVPGRGPAHAALMLVGEQPGDQEDIAGAPFVGPAGRVLDAGLERAGAPRDKVFITNAVKHFRHELRGKRRIHKTPGVGHVEACRWWLDAERRLVKPKVVVAMGATAALGVFGKATPVGANRGKPISLDGGRSQGFVTYHPSYLLRLPDEAAKKAAFREFVSDLRTAWEMARG